MTLIPAVIGGVFLTNSLSHDHAGTPLDPAVGKEPPSVQTIHPSRAALRRTTTQPGIVHAFSEAKVYARVTGYLKELKADIGTRVEEGQVLARIEVPELDKKRERWQAEIAKLEAEEVQAGAEVETARAQVAAFEAQVSQARSEVKKTEALLAAELAELHRIEKVAKSGTLDQGVLNEAQNRYQGAQAAKQVAESAVEAARANATLAAAKLRAAQACAKTAATRTEVARKELAELDATIGFATLKAPFRGVVTTRGVDEGDLVGDAHQSSSPGPLFKVCFIDKLRIRVPVPERDAAQVKEGNPAEFRCQAFPGKVFAGKVSRVAGGLEMHTKTMTVEVDLDNPQRALLPGMFGEATLVLQDRPDRLVLPTGAVHQDKAGKAYVLATGAEDKVCRLDVVTGQDDGKRIEIVQGLTGQEQVISVLPAGLTPGQVVRCVPLQ